MTSRHGSRRRSSVRSAGLDLRGRGQFRHGPADRPAPGGWCCGFLDLVGERTPKGCRQYRVGVTTASEPEPVWAVGSQPGVGFGYEMSFSSGGRRSASYVDVLTERYPWAETRDLQRAAVLVRDRVRQLVDEQLTEGTRKLDWTAISSVGSELASIVGPVPNIGG